MTEARLNGVAVAVARAVDESMDINASCPLAAELAQRIRDAREDLTHRWLERIVARVALDPNRVFPSEQLLDHVPVLMDGIAAYVEDPAEEISADVPVIVKAMELGTLRLNQGFDAHEILKEYEILGGVLFNFAAREVEATTAACAPGDLLVFSHRLFRAIAVIAQATTSQYLRAMSEKVNEREERLRSFNRMVSHELKNKVGAVLGAGELIREDWLSTHERQRFAGIVIDNAQGLKNVLDNLAELSRLDKDTRLQRNIMVREAVIEVVRQQREMARARDVMVVVEDMPRLEVHAATVELCLANYLSNSIKYSDPNASERWVRVRAEIKDNDEEDGSDLVVSVQDNGVGVLAEVRDQLFQRFFRSEETALSVEGTGIGLSLVRETLASMGGRAWAEFSEGTSTFLFSMPCRRRGEGVTPQAANTGNPAAVSAD